MMLAFIGIVFFGTILIGVPVAFGMGLAGATWILFFEGIEPTILARRFYFALGSFPLLAIPLFIMLGLLADRARMLPHLVVWLQMLLGRTARRHGLHQRRRGHAVRRHQRHGGLRYREPRPHR